MTDKQTLLALAELFEATEAPGRELDAQIGRIVGAKPKCSNVYRRNYYPRQLVRVEERYPAYTASLDAAMTLVDAEAYWQVGHDGEGRDPSMFAARVFDPMTMKQPCASVAETAPLALCAAALRSRAHADS